VLVSSKRLQIIIILVFILVTKTALLHCPGSCHSPYLCQFSMIPPTSALTNQYHPG